MSRVFHRLVKARPGDPDPRLLFAVVSKASLARDEALRRFRRTWVPQVRPVVQERRLE